MKMVTIYLVCRLTMLWILSLSTLSVKADREPRSITLDCGGIKNVTSPNYPDNYKNDLDIHWDVRANIARIRVTMNDFQTEVHDHLRIEEENYPSSKASYSGSKAATPYISFGNHLEIIFTSDSSESRTGFHLSISCYNGTDYTGIHRAFEGLEYTRVMTQPVCKAAWHTNVSDTVCREAGFPGSYETNFTNETENISESEEINYQCTKSTFRLQDCNTSRSRCIAQDSLVIVCSVLSELGCFDLAEYTYLLSGSVKLSRDQCLTHCKALSTTPQYAVHQHRNNCSCINQTALDVTKLAQEHSRCRTTSESQTGHYATLFNVSLGFCSEPPELDKGSWINTSNGFMYGTTITAKCNENYELVDGDGKMRCDKATTSTTQDFEWHGTSPSCLKKDTVLSELGCFDLAEYTHLLSGSVKLSGDECLTHCRALYTTPQYAVHQNQTNCSCINQTALDVTKLTQDRSRCRTTSESQTGHYATLFNVSLGFCSEPPELDNGSWNNTSNRFMYGTTITAKCNENYELDGDGKMRCDKAITSTTQDFEWHGSTPSCLKKNTGTSCSKICRICLAVFIPAAAVVIFVCLIWKKRDSCCFGRSREESGGRSRRRSRRTRTQLSRRYIKISLAHQNLFKLKEVK